MLRKIKVKHVYFNFELFEFELPNKGNGFPYIWIGVSKLEGKEEDVIIPRNSLQPELAILDNSHDDVRRFFIRITAV